VPRFAVRLIVAGRVRTLEVDATDADAARDALSGRGRILDIRRRRRFPLLGRGLDRNERHILLIRLAAMTDSRVGLAEAARRIAGSFRGRIRRAAERLSDSVEAGDDLATAMGRFPEDFPPTVVALIRAGAYGAGTSAALRAATAFEADLVAPREGFLAALTIAVFQAILSAAIMIGSAHVIAPALLGTEMFRQGGGSLDVEWVLVASDVVSGAVILFLVVLAALGALGTVGRRIAPRWAEATALGLPIYRDVALGIRNHAVFHELSMLIAGGVPLDRALTLVEHAAPAGAMRDELRLAARAVSEGRDWSAALRSVHPTDRASLAAADNREELARTMRTLAEQHRDLYLHAVRVSRPALQSLSMIILAVAGAVLFGLTILPMLQIADHMVRIGL